MHEGRGKGGKKDEKGIEKRILVNHRENRKYFNCPQFIPNLFSPLSSPLFLLYPAPFPLHTQLSPSPRVGPAWLMDLDERKINLYPFFSIAV